MDHKVVLMMVESPAKVKTISQFLPSNYRCMASYGHIMDLPVYKLGVNLKDFSIEYVPLEGKAKWMADFQSAVKKCSHVLLATDPDREGEVISWHIAQCLPENITFKRIVFNAITEDVILSAIANPRDLNTDLIDSQKARRIVDRIVGYTVSGILNKGFGRFKGDRLSAGRVQSAALALIVDREREILNFIVQKYWRPSICCIIGGLEFEVQVVKWNGALLVDKDREPQHLINSKDIAESFREHFLSSQKWNVASKKASLKSVSAPFAFTTASLQKTAYNQFKLPISKTMNIVQKLYEGVDCGNGRVRGLITYIRTDSVRVDPKAQKMATDYIVDKWGPNFAVKSNKKRKIKAPASVQDAHEAIRPLDISFSAQEAKQTLSGDELKVYVLIWETFVESQMAAAKYEHVDVVLVSEHKDEMSVSAKRCVFDGFEIVSGKVYDAHNFEKLQTITMDCSVVITEVTLEEKETAPRPRYTEGSLVASLESLGIGRPSTYVPILNKIKSRHYTTIDKGVIFPTPTGIQVIEWLEAHFKKLIEISFTSDLEEAIESIADKQATLHAVLSNFWGEFSITLEAARSKTKYCKEEVNEACELCGAPLLRISNESNEFLGCSKYPSCKYVQKTDAGGDTVSKLESIDKEQYSKDFDWEQTCKKCNEKLVLRNGKYGVFLSCANFRECKYNVSIPAKNDRKIKPCIVSACPGFIWEKRKKGKLYYVCSSYKTCGVFGNTLEDISVKEIKPKPEKAKSYKAKGDDTKK